MCHQTCCAHLSADESLLVYCKPVELYNILHRRSKQNPSFLRRCLRYGRKVSRKRRLMAGTVIFNYRDYNNMLQKTEVTEDFSCPFCLIQCISFKGLRYHLCSSHDLFNFEFWVTEEYQAVNVSVKFDRFRCETVADGVEQRRQTFFFCSRLRRDKAKKHDEVDKQACVQFLELDSPKIAAEVTCNGFWAKDDGENASKSSSDEKDLPDPRHETENCGPVALDLIERVASSSNIPGVSIAMAHSCMDPECVKSQWGSDHSVPVIQHVAKSRKLTVDRSESRNHVLLQKRQFYHSHRVQVKGSLVYFGGGNLLRLPNNHLKYGFKPMALEQVISDRDSEDEVDDDIADFEDRRMLDDFVDVSRDEKQLMHLWNSFVRKQRVLADGHVPWACEAFSKLHGLALVTSPALFWCWRLFMIKLWNHGLLDSNTMNNCNVILEKCRDEGSNSVKREVGRLQSEE